MLKVEQIRELKKNPKNRNNIAKAISHEARLRFHTETALNRNDVSGAINDFLRWVEGLIPTDKYQIFLSLFKFPVLTNDIVEKIYNALEKVFDGRNPYYNAEFISSEAADDWKAYRKEIGLPGRWKVEGFNAMKTAINSVLIVDLPTEQKDILPEPYFYFLDIINVIDYETVNGTFDWIMFSGGEFIYIFDDTYYRSFKNINGELGELITEYEHGLGYCPARWFWTTPLKNSNPDIKRSPISNQLTRLDWLLFYSISKQHLDLYAPYPIYSGFETDCDYSDAQGNYCNGGFLKDKTDKYVITRDGTVAKCPICGDKRLAGVGSFIEIPVPSVENNNADLRNPVQITTVDKDSLEYNVSEVNRLSNEIYTGVVGYGGDLKNDQAVNEKQIAAAFDSRTTVLLSLKVNLEAAMKWVEETLCRLRYGGNFSGVDVNIGDEFYLYTSEQLHSLYKQAKENGASQGELDNIYDRIIETENRNNPERMRRLLLLKHIEPLRHHTDQEALDIFKAGVVDKIDLIVKLNLITFVQRFERENMNIVDFGDAISFDKKVKIIQQKLKDYAREQTTE